MVSGYTEHPGNFDRISEYIITDTEEAISCIVMASQCYFYDACSFRKHVHMRRPESFFLYVKQKKGIVIITRTILMELSGKDGTLREEYIEYIKAAYDAGLKILVFYEEDIFQIMSVCFNKNDKINQMLSYAVRAVKTATGAVTEALDCDSSLRTDLIEKITSGGSLYLRFFREVRSRKESGDNLGEELVIICMHVFSNLPDKNRYKYVLLTEDKGAIGLLNRANKNISKYNDKSKLAGITTAALLQRMFDEGVLNGEEMRDLFLDVYTEDSIKIVCTEEYDLNPKEECFSGEKLMEKIMAPGKIHIYY